MKKIFIIGAILLSSITSLWAQPQRPQAQRGSGDFQKFQMQLIIRQLEIAQRDQDSFEQIYTQYSSEMNKLRPEPQRRGDEQNQTDAEVEAQILKSFEMAEQTTALKKEYYNKFKTILSPKQILKMYNIERQFTERLNSEMQNRGMGGERERGTANR